VEQSIALGPMPNERIAVKKSTFDFDFSFDGSSVG